jgi:hypothetical protein
VEKNRAHPSFLLASRTGGGYCPGMPRTARADIGGIIYHALNRGNARQQIFFN